MKMLSAHKFSLSDEEDLYYCHDTGTLPEALQTVAQARQTKSLLLSAVRNGDGFHGFVGLETHVHNRLWTREEIDILIFLSHLADLFLWSGEH